MESIRLSRADWPHYKREALIALATVTAAVVVAGASYHLYDTVNRSRQQAEASLQAAQNDLANVENEQAELVASLPLYRNLIERSIIGNEQRLNWHETLKTEQQKHSISRIGFSLAPRQAFNIETPGNVVAEIQFKRYRSTMKLGLEFQRETALVDFLEGVAAQAHAMTIIRGCQISRKREPDQAAADQLTADCIVDWATLERTGPAAEANPS